MNRKEQEREAQERQALLESMFSPQEIQKMKQFDALLAQNALASAELRDSKIEVLDK